MKNEVDNFDLIRSALSFDLPRTMYFIQILKRRKDNPDQKSFSRPIESFYVFSLEQFDRFIPVIKSICERENARAYIKMNPLDAQSVALTCISNFTELIRNENWHCMSSVLNSSCGQCGNINGFKKLYLVDLDDDMADRVNEVSEFINALEPIDNTNKIYLKVPTRNGIHLLCNGFNKQKFGLKYPNVDVHKDGITILYIPPIEKEN